MDDDILLTHHEDAIGEMLHTLKGAMDIVKNEKKVEKKVGGNL